MRSQGQAVLEYAILIGIVTAALVGIQLYAKRSIQAGIQMAADQVGSQKDGMRYESGERINRAAANLGAVQAHEVATRTITSRLTQAELLQGGGRRTTVYRDTSDTSGALSQCGSGTCGPGTSYYSEVVSDRPRQ